MSAISTIELPETTTAKTVKKGNVKKAICHSLLEGLEVGMQLFLLRHQRLHASGALGRGSARNSSSAPAHMNTSPKI
jgi:hypothetical protein